MKHKDLSTEYAAGTVADQTENRHYSFHHQHRHLWHCAWVWILIVSLLTPQFSYEVEAGLGSKIKKNLKHAAHKIEKYTIRPATQKVVPKFIREAADHIINEVDSAAHKVEKHALRPMNDPKVIGKVAAMVVVAVVFPPGEGLVAAALAAGTTSAAYDRVVFNIHNGGDLTKSFLKGGANVLVTAAVNSYLPDNNLGSLGKYGKGVIMSVSHIAADQAVELAVEGEVSLKGSALSGAIAGAFVPSISMLPGVENTKFVLGGIEVGGSSIVPIMDAFNRSVVEQSVKNKFNMKKVDFGSAVASGAQALRDQYIKEKTVEFAKVVENWYESEQESSTTKRKIASERENKNKKSISDYVEEKAMSKNITGVVVDLNNNTSLESILDAFMEAYCKGVPVVIIDESGNKYACKMARPLNDKLFGRFYFNSTSLFRHDLWVEFEDGKIIGDYGFHARDGGIKGAGEVKINEHLERDYRGREYNYDLSLRENGEPICYRIEYVEAIKADTIVKWNSKTYQFNENGLNCKGFSSDIDEGAAKVKTCSEWQASKNFSQQNKSQK